MKRKLIKQGTSSLTISLPSSWTKKFNLEGGDEIYLFEEEKKLIISTKESFSSKKSKIDVSGLKESLIWIHLSNLYIRGDDEIEVKVTSKKEKNIVLDVSQELLGFTIIEQSKERCVLKDISGASDDSFDALFRRIMLLILDMANEGFDLLNEGNIEEVNELSKQDNQINRLSSFCLRTLNKKGHNNFEKTSLYSTTIYFLENIGDEYAKMFRDVKTPVSKKTISLFQKVIKINQDFNKIHYKYDVKLASLMIDERNELRNEIDSCISKANQSDIIVLYRIKKIAELIIDVLKIQINSNI